MIVPVVPTPLSLRALDKVLEHVADKKVGKTRLRPFFSMADRRRKLHRELLATPPATMQPDIGVAVDYASNIERMGEHRAPVACFAPRSRAAAARCSSSTEPSPRRDLVHPFASRWRHAQTRWTV